MDAPLDPRLLSLLADPTDPERPALELHGDRLVNPRNGTSFPVQDGIPRLLPTSAIPAGTETAPA